MFNYSGKLKKIVKKFQIASDVHLENQTEHILTIIKPCAKNLIIAGDLGRVENWAQYKDAIEILCGAFENVVLIPGDHEYYCSKPIDMRIITKKLKELQTIFTNLSVLIDECVTIDGTLIYGSIFWSFCPLNSLFIPIYTTLNGDLVPINVTQYNKLHEYSVKMMERMIQYCKNVDKRMIVVSHYAPTFLGTLAPKHGKGDLKNYLYCSDNDQFLLENVVRIWVYGHTGYNGVYGKLVTNQLDISSGIPNAVLSLDR